MEKIKVLHVVSSLSGGVGVMLYNYYKHMNEKKIIFDFIVHGNKIGEYENFFISRGSSVLHITPKNESAIGNIVQIKKALKSTNYKIIHCHQGYLSIVALFFAKKYAIKNRIIHAHSVDSKNNIFNKMIRHIFIKKNNKYANFFFACSVEAANYHFGSKCKFLQINNAIDVSAFEFDNTTRQEVRNELNIKDEFVIGNVGRLIPTKNLFFLLEVFKHIVYKKKRSKLLIIGEGELKEEIKEKVIELGLQQKVQLLGYRDDVNRLMQAMDFFLFTSLSEGLGIVLIEAQASGLPCVASNQGIPKETAVTSNIVYISPNSSPETWAQEVLMLRHIKRIRNSSEIAKKGYDIGTVAIKLLESYTSMNSSIQNI